MRTTIVIPTYNERESLRPLVERISVIAAQATPFRSPSARGGEMSMEVLIVDDHSPDGTGELAEELARKYGATRDHLSPSGPDVSMWKKIGVPTSRRDSLSPRSGEGEGLHVRVLHRPCKEGLGAAYVAGFRDVLSRCPHVPFDPHISSIREESVNPCDCIIAQMDADGSHEPEEIPGMIELLFGSSSPSRSPSREGEKNKKCFPPSWEGGRGGEEIVRLYDVVIGSRRVPGGCVVGWGWHRRLASWAAQSLSRILLGLRTRDVTSGFRVWRAEALARAIDGPPPQLPLPRGGGENKKKILSSGYAFQIELLHRAEASGLRVVEYPITFRDREHGVSKLGLRDILGFFRTLTRLWWSDRERRFAVWLGLSLIILTSLPYLYGWLRTPPGHVYTGVHALASGDMAVYGSYIEQVREGRWTFVDLFTSEWPQRPFLNVLWLPVGLLARITRLPTVVTFHLARVLLVIPFVLFLVRFIAAFLKQPIAGFPLRTVRRVTLMLIAFSSGVGPLVADAILPLSNARWRTGYDFWPMDLWVPESNTFLTLFQSPHFIASLWLLLFVILSTLRFTTARHWGWSIAAGAGALVLFQFHPFYVPTIAVLLVGWTIVESLAAQRIRYDLVAHGAIVGAISAPSVFLHLWYLMTDPITAARASQNLLLTTDWWLVALSYGFLVPLALIGMVRLGRGRTIEGRLLLTWLVVTIVLIYSPLTWQRRLTEGLHVVIVLIAMVGLFPLLVRLHFCLKNFGWLAWLHRYGWNLTTATIIAVPLLGVSTVVNLVRDFALYTIRFPQSIPRHSFYYPTDAADAMRWIQNRTSLGEATFAVGIDGHFLPMYAGRQTVLGHGVETANFVEKYDTSYALTGGRLSLTDARLFLERERVRFILVTDASRGLWSVDPATIPGVTLAYRNEGAEAYELAPLARE